MKLLLVSTYKRICGIADYTENLRLALLENNIETVDVFSIDVDLLKKSSLKEALHYFSSLYKQCEQYDYVHIQHETSFFAYKSTVESSLEVFSTILNNLNNVVNLKKIIVTFHSPTPITKHIPYIPLSLNPINLFNKIKRVFESPILKKSLSIISQKDSKILIIVHNEFTKTEYSNNAQIDESRIKVINLGISKKNKQNNFNNDLKNKLKKFTENSKILTIQGFINGFKGHLIAIKALTMLPAEYKLLILGGKHPQDYQSKEFNEVLELIPKLNLKDRVYITDLFEESDLSTYEDITDLFLLPYLNTFRSSSAAMASALNSGKLIIASSIDPFLEINQQFPCLKLVSPNCPAELAFRIEQLLSPENELERQTLHQNIDFFINENSYVNIAKKHIEAYRS